MDLRKLKKLIDLVEESGITELEVTEGEEKVRIVKHSTAPAQHTYMVPQTMHASHAAPAVSAGAAVAAEEAAQPEGHVVKSPMVGTFTAQRARAPSLLSRSALPSRSARHCALLKR